MAAKTSPRLPSSLKLWEQTHGSPREGLLRESIYFQEHRTRVHLSDQRGEVSVTFGSWVIV